MSLISTATNPCPPLVINGFFKTRDGLNLRFARWIENDWTSRGTVCILSGRGEFIEKYYEVIGELRKRKFNVAIFDWRGQGGSDRSLRNPKKGHVKSFKKYDNDLQDFMKEVVLPFCPGPYIALGHSMGGTILLRNLTRNDTFFSCSILTAPMIAIADIESDFKQKITKIVLEFLCFFGLAKILVPERHRKISRLERFEKNNLTSDFTRWERTKDVINASSILKIGPPTFGWTRAAFRALMHLQNSNISQRIKTPILIFAAGSDGVVSSRWTEKFSKKIKHCTFIYLHGALHEILQEKDQIRQRFWAAFDAYTRT